MNKTFLKRSVASVLSILMAFSTAVPNTLAFAENAVVESTQEYVATIGQTENGTVSFVSNGQLHLALLMMLLSYFVR